MAPVATQEQYYSPQTQIESPPSIQQPQTLTQTMTPGEQAASIRAILQGFSEDQREEFYQSLDSEGF